MMRTLTLLCCTCLAVFLSLASAQAEDKNFAAKKVKEAAAGASAGNAARAWLSYYRGEQKQVDYATISKFITNHPDFPAINKLRAQAEQAMPSSLSDREALEWFSSNPPQTTFGMRMYANALSNNGQGTLARQKINDWWRETTSLTPGDQSKAFMAFASVLDKSAHAERLRRLLHRQQYTNARAVAEALGPAYMALAEARIGLQTQKGNVNELLYRVPSALANDEGLLYDRLVYRRKGDNNPGAIEILKASPSGKDMDDQEEWGKERGIIVRRLFEERRYAEAYRLSADHRLTEGPGYAANEWMAGWLAMDYLKKPWDGFEHFERFYHNASTPISKSRAAYWAGVSSERLGHPEIARKWYNAGAKYSTTFYGQLSGEKLGRANRVSSGGASPTALKNGSLANAARWLRQNGYKIEAGLFLNRMIEISKTPGDFAATAQVADELSMRNLAIKAAAECEKKTGQALVGYAFPKVERFMNDVDVEWALVHALIRQESRYDSDAVSSAGARGLMQLMPATANEVARKAGLSHQTGWLTAKPGHNVALGTRYLQQLLARYDGNYAMTLAAYNAGPSRVTRWVKEYGDPRDPRVDLVTWIEMIPIYETRNYVQRVLEGVYVYRQTLSKNQHRKDGGLHLAAQ